MLTLVLGSLSRHLESLQASTRDQEERKTCDYKERGENMVNLLRAGTERDVMSSLFEIHVEHILIKVTSYPKPCPLTLSKVFLYLDARSLFQAQQVSTTWNRFIREELWGRRYLR